MMNEKDWLILVILDKERNITKTAEQLFISQPALSYRIKLIEEYFKTRLFIRGRNGIRLTPQGEVVVEYAKEMQKKLTILHETIEFLSTEVKGTIKIGVSSTFGQYILPDLLQKFLSLYPDVNVNITTGLSVDIYNILEKGDIHIAIIRGQHQWEEEKMLITIEPICAVAKTQLDIFDLANKPRIIYKIDPYLQGLIDNWWNNIYDQPSLTTTSVDSLETCKELARTGLGYTILPGISLIDESNLTITPLKLPNGKYVLRKTWAFYRHNNLKIATVRAFVNFLENYKQNIPDLINLFK